MVIVKSDGSAYAMGQNTSGALGNANYIDQTSPAQIFPSGVKSAAAGRLLYPLLKKRRKPSRYGKQCKRAIRDGRYTSNRNSPFQIISSGVTLVLRVSQTTPHPEIQRKRLRLRDKNNYGQLGTGNTNNFNAPTQIFSSGVIQIASGAEHSLFLKADGSLWATGRNQRGQLGTGDTVDEIYQPKSFLQVSVASGSEHSVFLKSDGSLHVMGSNINGQLGTGDNLTEIHRFKSFLSGVVEIAAGASHTVFLKADGSLWTFGWNSNGQLGVGDTANRSVPTMVLPSGVTRLSEVTDDFRHFPTDLNSTAALAFAENRSVRLSVNSTQAIRI